MDVRYNTMRAVVVAMWLLTMGAHAQISRDPAAFGRQWGPPVSGAVDTNGLGALSYASEAISIEGSFVAGICQRVVYRSAALDTGTISRLLKMNSDDAQWDELRLPGRRRAEGVSEEWMRSDESAMATLSPGALTLLGTGWHRHLAERSLESSTNAPPVSLAHIPKTPAAVPPSSPEGISGLWMNEASGLPLVVLRIREDGALAWIVLADTGRYEWSARLTQDVDDNRDVFILSEDEGTSEVRPRTIGTAVRESSDMLRIRAADTGPLARSARWQWNDTTEVLFERIHAMPQWKPAPPAGLPSKGDSKADVLKALGAPSGSMTSGGRDVLVYPWGNVWIVDGKVVRVK